MEEAQQNESNSIEEEQKQAQMELQSPRHDSDLEPNQQGNPQQIRPEDNQQQMQQEKENQPEQHFQNQEEQVEEEAKQEAEDPEIQEENRDIVAQQEVQQEEQVQAAQQRSPSIQEAVENQIQAQVEQLIQQAQPAEAQLQNLPEQRPQQQQEEQQGQPGQLGQQGQQEQEGEQVQQERQEQQEQQQQEGEVQQAAIHMVAPPQNQNQPQQPQLFDGEELQRNLANQSHQQAQDPIPQNNQIQQRRLQELQKQKEDQYNNNQLYLHYLERQLEAAVNEKNGLKENLTSLKQAQIKLRQQYETSKQNTMDLRKKKLEAEIEKTKALKECEKLKRENEVQRKKIQEIEKIGDVIVLKNALQELNLLAQTQREEIEQLKTHNSSPLIQDLKERLTLIQRYEENQKIQQTQISKLADENKVLTQENTQLSADLSQKKNQVQSLRQKEAELQDQIANLSLNIREWQTKWNEFQAERQSNTKARQLEKKIFDYESQKNLGYQSELIQLNVLSDREEKDIILREFLGLQGKYKQQNYEFEEAKTKLRKLQRQQNRVYANYIKKKEYIDLSVKYRKAKKCLEGAFQQLRLIRNDESQYQNVEDQVNELLQGIQARQCQKLIKNTQTIVSNLHDKIDSLEQTQNVSANKRENQHLQQIITGLKNQQASNQRLLKLMTDDITLKNRLIAEKNQIIANLRKRTHLVHNQIQSYKITLKLQNEVASLKESVSIFETQNILLVKQISALNSQAAHWKFLYNKVKQGLKDKISNSLEQKSTNGVGRVEGQQSASVCRECEERKLILSAKQLENIQTQTDNLNEFYYKEIKDILAYLNKISKECEKIPNLSKEFHQILQQIRDKFSSEFKERYLKIQNIYNSKLNELKREKHDNDSWRIRTKEQIREEFQDIRDLVMNNRLANALRQAKNLIDYLQAEAYKQDDENQAEEMEEENPPEEGQK